MRPPVPLRQWAVISRGDRARWISPFTINRTRRGSIASYLAIWGKHPHNTWKCHRARGFTCERVTITLATAATHKSSHGRIST